MQFVTCACPKQWLQRVALCQVRGGSLLKRFLCSDGSIIEDAELRVEVPVRASREADLGDRYPRDGPCRVELNDLTHLDTLMTLMTLAVSFVEELWQSAGAKLLDLKSNELSICGPGY